MVTMAVCTTKAGNIVKHALFTYKQIITTRSTAFAVVKYCVPTHGILIERIEKDVQNATEG